jgi:quercetin dioxygenase-like cupin family protein
MSESSDRLRPPPAARFAGPEHRLDFGAALAALRRERHAGSDGHRQIAVLHDQHLRLILFAFDQGGRLREHRAPGTVVIHTLRGSLRVRTSTATHDLPTGTAVVLAADVVHDVEAVDSADMLLTVALAKPHTEKDAPD